MKAPVEEMITVPCEGPVVGLVAANIFTPESTPLPVSSVIKFPVTLAPGVLMYSLFQAIGSK